MAATKTRQVKHKPYQSFRLGKRQKPAVASTLPSAWKLFTGSLKHLRKYWRPFLGVVLIYLLLTIIFVKGFGVGTGVAELKTNLNQIFTGVTSQLSTSLTLFALLLSSTGTTTSEVASLYQTILLIIVSLAVIWLLRQTYGNHKTSVKDSFYKGMYPLIPFVGVLGVIGLQLGPMLVGSWLYSSILASGVAVTGIEQFLWWLIIGLLALLSLYMITSSLFALYIVTLPDMTPFKALRSAREIVRHRRWTVMRKVFVLPLLLIISTGLVMIPLILFVTPLAEWTFFILNMSIVAVVHTYLYGLYRELL